MRFDKKSWLDIVEVVEMFVLLFMLPAGLVVLVLSIVLMSPVWGILGAAMMVVAYLGMGSS